MTTTDENPDFVCFGDVCRKRIGIQCQYSRHYLREPGIGEGIRWQGRFEDYHGLTIHKDDVELFVERAIAWRRKMGIIA
jgi:hypothetical protein